MKNIILLLTILPFLAFSESISEPFKVAAVEFNPVFMELEQNIKNIQKTADEVAAQGAKLIVFPEMVTCGYIYKDRKQVEPFLDTIPGKTTQALEEVCKKHDAYITVGIGEKDLDTNLGYNATALIGPKGYIGKYRHGNHSTVANVQYMTAWNGVHLIVADRSNSESNPETGLVVHYNGASSIWDGNGKKVAGLPYTDVATPNTDAPRILYATIDPKTYDNPLKKEFARRRPELYGDLALFRAPTDPRASTESKNISALTLQYEPVFGEIDKNSEKVRQLLKDKKEINLVVLPAYSLTGYSSDAEAMKKQAQSIDAVFGNTFAKELLEGRVTIYGVLGGHQMREDGSLTVDDEYSPDISWELSKLLIHGFLLEVLNSGSTSQQELAKQLQHKLNALTSNVFSSSNLTSPEYLQIVEPIRHFLDPNFKLICNGALIETQTSYPLWNTALSSQ